MLLLPSVHYSEDGGLLKPWDRKLPSLNHLKDFVLKQLGALTLFGATHFGIPVSTTHTITGSIIGVGATKRMSAVKWGVTTKIFWAWILTIPVSALIGASIYYLLSAIL